MCIEFIDLRIQAAIQPKVISCCKYIHSRMEGGIFVYERTSHPSKIKKIKNKKSPYRFVVDLFQMFSGGLIQGL